MGGGLVLEEPQRHRHGSMALLYDSHRPDNGFGRHQWQLATTEAQTCFRSHPLVPRITDRQPPCCSTILRIWMRTVQIYSPTVSVIQAPRGAVWQGRIAVLPRRRTNN